MTHLALMIQIIKHNLDILKKLLVRNGFQAQVTPVVLLCLELVCLRLGGYLHITLVSAYTRK